MKRRKMRRVQRNSSGKYGVMLTDIQLLGTSLNLKKGEKVRYESATNIPGGGVFVRPVKLRGIWKMVSPNDAIYIKSSEFAETILNWKDRKFLPFADKFGRNLRGNPSLYRKIDIYIVRPSGLEYWLSTNRFKSLAGAIKSAKAALPYGTKFKAGFAEEPGYYGAPMDRRQLRGNPYVIKGG